MATVDGHHIHQDDVVELAEAQANYLEIQLEAAKAGGSADPSAIAEAESSLEGYRGLKLETATAAEVLGTLIEIEVLTNLVADKGAEITQDERDAGREELMAQLEQNQITETAPFERLVEAEIERKLLYEKVQELAGPGEDYEAQLRQAYEENLDALEELCVQLIATADQESAQAAYDRVAGGEDFAAVAAEVSIDTTSAASGGDIGCVARGNLSSVFGDVALSAQPDDLLAPADGQGSWLFVQVNSTNTPSFEDSRATLAEALPDDSAAQAQVLLAEAFNAADVTVDPRYGTWDPSRGAVVPPVDRAPATTTVPELDPTAIDPTAGPVAVDPADG